MPRGKKKGNKKGNKIRGAGKRIKTGPRKGEFAKK